MAVRVIQDLRRGRLSRCPLGIDRDGTTDCVTIGRRGASSLRLAATLFGEPANENPVPTYRRAVLGRKEGNECLLIQVWAIPGEYKMPTNNPMPHS